MSASEIVLQPVDVEADVDLILRLTRDSEIQTVGRSEATRDRILSHLSFPLALRDQHRIALLDGEPVGAVNVECDPESREVFADPIAVGGQRQRVLAAMLEHVRSIAHEKADADPARLPEGEDPFTLRADIWQLAIIQRDGDEDARRVFEASGLRMIRTFWTMKWDVFPGAAAPVAPPGVTRRTVTSDDDMRILHRIDQSAFAEHFGFLHEDPYEKWLETWTSRPSFSTDRFWIAELDGEPVGMCLLDDSRSELGQEYVGVLAVLKEARGRGIAGWLLTCAGADAVARGVTTVVLNCDSENTTNATALYESVGFAVDFQVNLWVEPVLA